MSMTWLDAIEKRAGTALFQSESWRRQPGDRLSTGVPATCHGRDRSGASDAPIGTPEPLAARSNSGDGSGRVYVPIGNPAGGKIVFFRCDREAGCEKVDGDQVRGNRRRCAHRQAIGSTGAMAAGAVARRPGFISWRAGLYGRQAAVPIFLCNRLRSDRAHGMRMRIRAPDDRDQEQECRYQP